MGQIFSKTKRRERERKRKEKERQERGGAVHDVGPYRFAIIRGPDGQAQTVKATYDSPFIHNHP